MQALAHALGPATPRQLNLRQLPDSDAFLGWGIIVHSNYRFLTPLQKSPESRIRPSGWSQNGGVKTR